MGDFNATTENPAIIQFLKSGLLLDHATKKTKSSSRWKATLEAGLRIDHIFTSPFYKKATLQVDSNGDGKGNAASDHHPVRLRVSADQEMITNSRFIWGKCGEFFGRVRSRFGEFRCCRQQR